jgi:hypothetical protein
MDHYSVMAAPEWIALSDTHFKYVGVWQSSRAGRVFTSTRDTGWTVQRALSGGWWALHDINPDVGPFRTNEEAKAYVEATYALEE